MSNQQEIGSEVDRQCRALPHCAASGRLLQSPTVVLGAPDSSFTLECDICEVFVCGGCAWRQMIDVIIGDRTWFAWAFHCPRCNSPLLRGSRVRLWSTVAGDVADLRYEGPRLNGDAAVIGRVEAAAARHRTSAHIQLHRFNTAPTSDGTIHEVELATAEDPAEPLVWLYKAALCDRAGHAIAADQALRSFHRVRSGLPFDRVASLVSPNSEVRAMVEGLRRGAPPLSTDLARRRSAAYNPQLSSFDQRVDSYRREEMPLSEFLSFLFPDPPVAPQEVRDFFDALRLESSVNFSAVEAERAKMIEAYVAQADREQVQNLLARSVAMRLGSISQMDFYAELFERLDVAGIDFSTYPQMQRYRRYIDVTASIDPARMHGVIWEEVAQQHQRLARTAEERELIDATMRGHLLDRLLRYLDGKLGVARVRGSYASQPRAVHDLAKSLSHPPAKTQKPSLLERARQASWWKRLVGR